jgi:hypothetical protein
MKHGMLERRDSRAGRWIAALRLLFAVAGPFVGGTGAAFAQPPQHTPGISPILEGGPCGRPRLVGDPTFVPITPTATVNGPFSVSLAWSAPAGTYEVRTYDPPGAFMATVHLGATIENPNPPTVLSPIRLARPLPDGTFATKSDPSGTAVHSPKLPDQEYRYVVTGNLACGRVACGTVSARTQAPPAIQDAGGRYLEVRGVALDFTLPAFVQSGRVLRSDGTTLVELRDGVRRFIA